MSDFAAFGWVALEWWTWPALFATVMGAMYAGMLADRMHDRKREADSGPHPCLKLQEVDAYGVGLWCLKPEGHAGGHRWMLLDLYDAPEHD
jgi:hypothetical protein